MKLFYIAVMALSLGGCASTAGTTCFSSKPVSPFAIISTEVSEKELASFEKTTESIIEETSEKKEFYGLTPIKKISGIESANFNNEKLALTLLDKGLFEQYSAPVENVLQKTYYNAHPVRVLFGTVFSGGLIWLIAPTKASHLAFGCTEQFLISTKPNESLKVKTGKSDWQPIQKSHRILVSGFNKDYEFAVENKGRPNQVEIDLSSAILNTELTKNTNLKVACLDCDLLGSEEQNIYKDSKTNISLTHDFRSIKESLAESQKVRHAEEERIKIEQIKRDIEESKLRALQAKEDLKSERQKQGVPLDGFKNQCKELGFKVGSTDFGNCVLQLNEIK